MKKNITELVFILDKSGSMSGLESDTIGGYNSMLDKQRVLEGECLITTVLFNQNRQLLHDRINLKAIREMNEQQYQVGGMTALIDAIGYGIDKLVSVQKNTIPEYRAQNVLFVIITDGLENASRHYSAERVKTMIEHQKTKYGWEFIFLGANINAVETAGIYGINPERTADYIADGEGTRLSYAAMAETIVNYRQTGRLDEAGLDKIRKDMHKRGGRK